MAEYDLTRTIIPYLDRHLVFPLLSHLHESGLFTPEHVAAAQYELAKGTNMVDYIVSLYELLNPDSEVPQGVKLLRLLLLYILSYVDA
jgi:translation initiation factor 3 subunit E